ncbi:transposase [Streptomyces gibsoniae]|uniref:Transposase n=1 Tax=Streptomyces gibsoniae TaxID=3075529 RepID=A0ABU2U4Y9_9ACTN|nr:transposase [Streptomyces sp. DSM 41699]MDT0468072.1 transposase [Streptomyces sp. DSM 41699]
MFLRANEVTVIDVDRPDRKARRANGKSDPVDAYAAATAVLSGRANGRPKTRDGIVEAIRSLRVVRRSAIKARTQTINQIRTLIVSAPAEVSERLRGLPTYQLISQLARSRPGTDLADPSCAVRTALRRLARRHQNLTEEIAEADAELEPLVVQAAPGLLELIGVGTETAAQLLITAGDNPDRLKSEASFAHLCGAAPISANSGRTDRHRLNRGGDRQANHALHTIVLVRMRYDTRTRLYVARRTAEGMGRWCAGWEPSVSATTNPQSATAPPPSRCRPIPRRRRCSDRGRVVRCSTHGFRALSTRGRASAQRGRNGPEAGAAPAAEPGARPAERSAAGA